MHDTHLERSNSNLSENYLYGGLDHHAQGVGDGVSDTAMRSVANVRNHGLQGLPSQEQLYERPRVKGGHRDQRGD
jgi:hypothetical protein